MNEWRSPTKSELWLPLQATALPVITGSPTTTVDRVKDEDVSTHSPADFYNNYAVAPNVVADDYDLANQAVIECLDEEVATLDGNILTRVTDGTARVRLRTPRGDWGLDLNMSEQAGGATETREFADGTLAKHLNDQILDRIDSLTPSVAKPLFSSQNHTTGEFTRNEDCWLSGVDLTCISPSNSKYGALRAGVAISPRHVICARHYPLTVGTILRFVTMAGETVTREIVDVAAQEGILLNDIAVALLDSDLPGSITPCKVMPSDWQDFLPNISNGVLVWGTDQGENGLIREIASAASNLSFRSSVYHPTTLPYYANFVPGGSGSPIMSIIDDELVLLTSNLSEAGGEGQDYASYISTINSLMTTLGGGYQLTEYDLTSQFPRFAGENFTSRNQTFFTAHYDASDESSVTLDTGVSEIEDQRGNYHAVQVTGSNQPAYVDWGNGLKCLSFDGTTDFMELPNIPQANAKWCLAVLDTTALQSGDRGFLGSAKTTPNHPPNLYLGQTGGNYTPAVYRDTEYTASLSWDYRQQAIIEWGIGDPPFTRINDGPKSTGSIGTGVVDFWKYFGARVNNAQRSQVKCAELILAPFEPGANLRDWLLRYLRDKWGIENHQTFNGTTQYVDTGVTMDGWTEFTILLDVKWLSMSGYDVEGWYQSGSNLVRIGRSNGRRPWFDWGAGNRHPAGPTLSENTRYTLVGTSKSGGNAILYVDGTPIDTTAVGAYTLSNTTRPYWVGANNQGNSTANDIAHQTLYRHQIFDRQLTAAEVAFFHSKGASGDDPGAPVWSLF